MPKETFYFSHDYNARNDDKILELRASYGAEGYGIFWMIIETMAENENGGIKATLIGGLSVSYGVAKATLTEIIHACLAIKLFKEQDGYYFSDRLLKHKRFRQKLSEAGAEGARAKWAGHSPANGGGNAKERKGKENKGNKIEVPAQINGTVYFDAEKEILKNQIEFDRICASAHAFDADKAKDSLHKFHLHLESKNSYPQTRKQIFAGFEKWLLNEQNFLNNGKHKQASQSTGRDITFDQP